MSATTAVKPYGTYQRFEYQTVRLPAIHLPNPAPLAYPLVVALVATAVIALAMAAVYIATAYITATAIAAAYITASTIMAALAATLTLLISGCLALTPTVGNLFIGAVVIAIAAKVLAFLNRI